MLRNVSYLTILVSAARLLRIGSLSREIPSAPLLSGVNAQQPASYNMETAQHPVYEGKESGHWTVSISSEYDVLGPFPQQAREQHFTSPLFPLSFSNLTVDDSHTYYSSFPDGGLVRWEKRYPTQPGELRILYPDIRWAAIRATQGWAGLQHHSVARIGLTIEPPSKDLDEALPHSFRLSVSQGSMFAIVPAALEHRPSSVEWYIGDIYDLGGPKQSVPIPGPLSTEGPTKFDLWISADYEIRLFGDPKVMTNSDVPLTAVNVTADLDSSAEVVVGKDHFVPDIIGGWILGDVVALELTSTQGDWRVLSIENYQKGFVLTMGIPGFHLVSSQTRRLPLRIVQSQAITNPISIRITLYLLRTDINTPQTLPLQLDIELPLTLVPALDNLTAAELSSLPPLRQTCGSPYASMSLLLPPLQPSTKPYGPPVVALHGAGVPLLAPFWPAALPRQNHSWIVIPGGGSSWGYDWRGPSLQDAFAAVAALRKREPNMAMGLVVLGHSNGGQGAFHLASRFPDLVHSGMLAAAYQSAPLYVPNTWAHGVHFVDPTLEAVLKASTAGGDNDLFFGNLVRSRIKAVHGGDDTNVPVYHSRTAVRIVKTWNEAADIEMIEVPGKDHWWDEVFTEPSRAAMMKELVEEPVEERSALRDFTLTVMWPSESGSMGGWQVLDVRIPGQLARLRVSDGTQIRTTNARIISFETTLEAPKSVTLDGHKIGVNAASKTVFQRAKDGKWQVVEVSLDPVPRGPLSRVLVSPSFLTIVTGASPHHTSAARRLAWALHTYLGLDITIVRDNDALQTPPPGTTIVLGGPPSNAFAAHLLKKRTTPICFDNNGSFELKNRTFKDAGIGLLFMHGDALVVHGMDAEGFERALRAFPLRTGVPCPEWLVLGSEIDEFSFGGVLGAGFWAAEGGEEVFWMH